MSNRKVPRWVYKKQRAKAAKARQTHKVSYANRPNRNRVYPNRDFEARALYRNSLEGMLNRRVPKTRFPQPLPLFSKQPPEYMGPTQSAYLSRSVLPEYVAQGTNILKLRQQSLPFGMRRTIDAPDHY
ncbi:MAG: hypothetical protein HY051_04025 [Candidatus Aenigmarchaeota archaeon]|nr:hypothetical protein [Candidatus Aenigmarchaeota archaeon]